ncbi:MAG: ribonuclease E activity regulator RraA [Bacteroidota bacterium]
MYTKTADLCDEYIDQLEVPESMFMHFGANTAFEGPIFTLKVFEDNTLVRENLQKPGEGRVMVVDGGGSLRCALVGDRLAALAVENGWTGIVVNGCIRDSADIEHMPVGVMALNTCPVKSIKRGEGQENIVVKFASATFTPGHYLYADEDGIVVAPQKLELSEE